MKRFSIIHTVLCSATTGGAGFIVFLFAPYVPLVIAGCLTASAVSSIIWHVIFDRGQDGRRQIAPNEPEEKEKDWNLVVQTLGNLRKNSNEINGRVSQSLDIAIIAGGEIGENIRSVEKKAHGLHAKISDASSASEEITASISHCDAQMEKNEQAVSQTGSAVEEINANVRNMADITKQRTAALEKLKETIESGAQRVGLTQQSIVEVTTLVNEISGIVQVINGIAAQTNLLSMNAAIEAAHAGDAGKGFAVVADEVRKLAESTSTNSKSISDSIKNIVDKIEGAKKASGVAGETFTNIRNETNAFVAAFEEISQSTAELSEGMAQILKAVQDIKQISGEIAGGTKEMAAGSRDIDEALRKMKDYSSEILDDMEKVNAQAADLTGSQSGISQYAVDNNKGLAALYKTLEKDGILEKDGRAFNYDLIVLMHRNWLAQLRAFLDERKKSLTVTDKDYLNCDLGKWIYGEGKQYQHNEYYHKLEKLHQRFHGLAGEICRMKNAGDKLKAEELYKSLMDEYKQVVSLLSNMDETLNNSSRAEG
jgi:methyl-accepting chemotaxis protein